MSNILELKKISRSYQLNDKNLSIFKDINFSIKTKERVALVGPSGCGKTSFLHIAGLLEAPSSGDVYINGKKINWNSDKDLSNSRLRDIGFIFQFNNLLDDFNATENIALPYIIAGHKKKIAIEKAELLLSQVGLENRMKSFPNQLSGGEQQRVAIARSLINEPSIILADEPTGNLDFKSSMNVMELFNKLIEEYGCSIILATHDLNIADLQDKVISIDDMRF
ncbi:MAG: ABC transporter ATP-binding protein [Alphaproteobacteria bacterium]|tara:strand:- start:4294 stop:4962 length:669 start_codon:yes stop_codon:yes gene_type:complete